VVDIAETKRGSTPPLLKEVSVGEVPEEASTSGKKAADFADCTNIRKSAFTYQYIDLFFLCEFL
jgi:hypothetical protein